MMNSTPEINLHALDLWQHFEGGVGWSVHVRGHVFGDGFHGKLRSDAKHIDGGLLASLMRKTDGLFATIVEDGHRTFAAVDRVMSIPLFYGWDGKKWRVSDNGGALVRDLELGLDDINSDGALSMSMAGYTIGSDTLYQSLKMLPAGHAVLLGPGKEEQRIVYDRYSAWETEDCSSDELEERLTNVTLSILEKMIHSVEGRTIVVPLSAGLDSRLIVSGLKHLGYENVKCFSYGIPGNHEALGAEKIAKKLGYPWRFVPYHRSDMKCFFSSEDHAGYMRFADSCMNVPFEQDLHAVRTLQRDGYIPEDGVMVNGNSGDFISGNHILPPFQDLRSDLTEEQRQDLIVDTLTQKHFRLWTALATPENDARIKARLSQEVTGPLDKPEGIHGVYEFIELKDRQSKYVISGQRIYDYAGLDWRLPLWDCEYLDFWRTIPLCEKTKQSLYKNMLYRQNWGGVWQGDEWHFPQAIVPKWIRNLRLVLKVLHAPFGRAAWHRFEKRFLGYWMETLQVQGTASYIQMATDKRGARHMVAWLTEAYLENKGLDWRGQRLD